MWIIRTSSVLLATLVVSGLSFPHPDDAQYKIPSVGTGQRSQYYVLHSDGTFKYGFDTGDGAFESVKSHTLGNREGKFGYVDPDGKTIRLEYEAGEGGFVARGDHLPKPSPELAQALAAVVRSSSPFVDPLASGDGDASYGFRFQSEDHSRNEQSDADGTVTGGYSYVDENGVTRTFTYKAGKGIGFVIEGDGLTQDVSEVTPSVSRVSSSRSRQQSSTGVTPRKTEPLSTLRQAKPSVRGLTGSSFGHQSNTFSSPTQSSGSSSFQRTQQQAAVRSHTRKSQTPSRPIGAAVRASAGAFTNAQANIASTRSQVPGDSSYSFSYDAGDHSRSETSDSNRNIDGEFSFVADDGQQRTVTYVAGSSTGFQAVGDHLPKAPEADFGDRVSQASSSTRRNQKQSSLSSHIGQTRGVEASEGQTSLFVKKVTQQQPQSPPSIAQSSVRRPTGAEFAHTKSSHISPSRPFEEANIRSSFTPQGPYSFSYKTSSHSRSESGDENNNVIGNFAFVADDDGQNREIKYEAGSSTGFIAEGAHIPIGPIVPGAPSGQPTGRIVPVPSVRYVDPLADSDTDASYNFEFDSETYSRSESADEDGNVVGTYTVVDEDGTRVTYRFRAGKGIGFETEEVSRTQGPRPAVPIPYSGPLAGDNTGFTQVQASVTGTKFSPTARINPGFSNRLSTGHSGASTSALKTGEVLHHSEPRLSSSSRLSTGHSGASTSSFKTVGTIQHPEPKPFFKTPSSSHSDTSKSSFISHTNTRTSFTPSAILKSSLNPSHSEQVFPGFTLHSYAHSPDAKKFGYVLKFDN